jgi:uncharacterized protein YjeT (DUF2065 family)
MKDLLTALALMFVIEGAMYALFPEAMRDMIAKMMRLPAAQLRVAGLLFALIGFVLIGAIRGF